MTHKYIEATPVVTVGAYASLDAVGGKLEFEDACTAFQNSGRICRAYVTDKGKQDALLYLVLFSEDFTATADNAAFDVTDADLLNVMAVLEFAVADYGTFNDNSIATLGFDNLEVSVPFVLAEGGTSIFGQLYVKTSTPTYTATDDIRVRLVVHN